MRAGQFRHIRAGRAPKTQERIGPGESQAQGLAKSRDAGMRAWKSARSETLQEETSLRQDRPCGVRMGGPWTGRKRSRKPSGASASPAHRDRILRSAKRAGSRRKRPVRQGEPTARGAGRCAKRSRQFVEGSNLRKADSLNPMNAAGSKMISGQAAPSVVRVAERRVERRKPRRMARKRTTSRLLQSGVAGPPWARVIASSADTIADTSILRPPPFWDGALIKGSVEASSAFRSHHTPGRTDRNSEAKNRKGDAAGFVAEGNAGWRAKRRGGIRAGAGISRLERSAAASVAGAGTSGEAPDSSESRGDKPRTGRRCPVRHAEAQRIAWTAALTRNG